MISFYVWYTLWYFAPTAQQMTKESIEKNSRKDYVFLEYDNQFYFWAFLVEK